MAEVEGWGAHHRSRDNGNPVTRLKAMGEVSSISTTM
jgi:hypothetical protein